MHNIIYIYIYVHKTVGCLDTYMNWTIGLYLGRPSLAREETPNNEHVNKKKDILGA